MNEEIEFQVKLEGVFLATDAEDAAQQFAEWFQSGVVVSVARSFGYDWVDTEEVSLR